MGVVEITTKRVLNVANMFATYVCGDCLSSTLDESPLS